MDEHHPSWDHPLPVSRQAGAIPPGSPDAERVTYGSYFSSIARFCTAGGWHRLIAAAAAVLERPVRASDIEEISIFLVKHGAFYHPARLRVTVNGQAFSLVVNVALSNHGRRALFNEQRALAHLGQERPFGWFPRLYAAVAEEPPMFLGDWFDGFHEFHLTRRAGGNQPAIVVWDGAPTPRMLTDNQTADLYRNMAMILTACYDPISAAQIFPWHHAAGDFVVRVANNKAAVRLISVRDYAPMAKWENLVRDERTLMEALVVFFIHLSIRMRLDRLDGVYEVAWAPDPCLAPMIEGFFQGLDLTARLSGLPQTFPDLFRRVLNQYNAAALRATAGQIVASVFKRQAEEQRVVSIHLDRHIRAVFRHLAV
jgi:hypothetical protein